METCYTYRLKKNTCRIMLYTVISCMTGILDIILECNSFDNQMSFSNFKIIMSTEKNVRTLADMFLII